MIETVSAFAMVVNLIVAAFYICKHEDYYAYAAFHIAIFFFLLYLHSYRKSKAKSEE